jgi:cytochrome c oxidase assembly protein subunit 15
MNGDTLVFAYPNRTVPLKDADVFGAEPAQRAVTIWLFIVSFLIIGLIVFGGYVRLTRSGLSIVEWNVLTGVVPPIGEAAWQAEFAKYQQTPEFQKVNTAMTLAEYQTIFYVEYFHRLIARLAGLIVVVPLLVFLWKGSIPWRKSAIYLLIAALFGFQGFLGWYMVSSGLMDRPSVSHYRLTFHLLTALALLALTLWVGLNRVYGAPVGRERNAHARATRRGSMLLIVLVLQIAYGGLVAGLKAGHASDTWPLMFGYLLPPGLLTVVQPWWVNLVETAATVHFIHRWLAFVVLIVAALLFFVTRRNLNAAAIGRTLGLLLALIAVQIGLGISVIWFYVPLVLALSHQAVALLLFVTVIVLNHQLRRV